MKTDAHDIEKSESKKIHSYILFLRVIFAYLTVVTC